MLIRPATPADADAIWQIFQAVVAGRDTYTFAPDTPRDEGVNYWFGPGTMSFVAETERGIIGVYKLIANQHGLGAHVANASYMVHPSAAGRGVGHEMGVHSLREARAQGYDAMQFNFVVSTNRRAVALWQGLGFRIVGTIPRAFQHGTLGLVDAYVMHRFLDDIIVTFGADRLVGEAVPRCCAYAILPGITPAGARHPLIALVRSHDNVLLPGGGLQNGESHTDALTREVAEECGLRIVIHQSLGEAVQIVGGRDGDQLVEKRSRFFVVQVDEKLDRAAGHEVMWLPPDEALRAVTNESHAWALKRWARLNT